MIRKETYSVDVVLEHIRNSNHRVVLDGDSVRVKGVRMLSFLRNGITCVSCGVKGVFFAKEKTSKADRSFHLNLYGIKENGKEVLMTRDHIYPRSLGGSEDITNMQTMCQCCNSRKGNKI